MASAQKISQARQQVARLEEVCARLEKRIAKTPSAAGTLSWELDRTRRKLGHARNWVAALEYELNEGDAQYSAIEGVLAAAAQQMKEQRPRARILNVWLSPAHFEQWVSHRRSEGADRHTRVGRLEVRVWEGRGQKIDEVLTAGSDRVLFKRLYLPPAGVPTNAAGIELYQQLRDSGFEAGTAGVAVSETLNEALASA